EREAELAVREAKRAQLVRAEARRDGELAGVQELLHRERRIVDVAGDPADVDLLLQHLEGELLGLCRVEPVVQQDHLSLPSVYAALRVDRFDLELRSKERRRVE